MLMRARLMCGGLVMSICAACGSDVTQAHPGGAAGDSAATSGATTTSTTATTTGSGGASSTMSTGGNTAGSPSGQGGAAGSDSSGGAGLGGSNTSNGGSGGSTTGGDAAPPPPPPPIDGGPTSLTGKKGLWDFAGLVRIRDQASSGALKPAYDQAVAAADAALGVGPFAVTNKTMTPPSGDKHDYMGLARYFWPDPSKPNGLPYISKDGQSNPDVDSDKYDYHAMFTMSGAVTSLGLAYFLTRDEKYAQKAHDLLKVWYIDAATKMNPNLNYAQSVPGLATGRKEGIIDTLQMAYMIDALEMLRDSPAISAAEWTSITAWFTSFLNWLQTSAFGMGEEAATNNHGSWYDVQTMRYAIFLGNTTLAMQLAELAKTRRIAEQINPDGSEPQEIARTNSLYYSEYDLTANMDIAQLAGDVGVDLYGYQTADGRSVRKSLDYLAPYADANKVWPNPQIVMDDRTLLIPLLRRAGITYNAPAYEQMLQMYYAAQLPAHITQLVYPK